MAWLLVFYVVALVVLLMTSLWQQDVFTADIVRHWTTASYSKLLSGQDGLWLRIFGRTLLLAVIVTAIDVALAFPLAWFMARVLPARWRTLAFLAVVVPLWSSILVRIFAWRTILGGQGVLNTFLLDTGLLSHPSSAFLYDQTAIVITWCERLAAVHGAADLHRAGEDPRQLPGGRARPRRRRLGDVSDGRDAARAARASSPARSSSSR